MTKAIIPVAGEGTRLRPHTYAIPKCLIGVAGKPILAHILDELLLYDVKEVVLVVGHLGDQVERYVRENYKFQVDIVQQPEPKGLGHAVYLTRKFIGNDSILTVYGDTLFKADLTDVLAGSANAIGVKKVEDWRRFGVVVHKGKRIVKFVEKPKEPISDLAIVGVNYIVDTGALFESLEYLIEKGKRTKGEYQLTDAFQMMLDSGVKMQMFEVDGWYDCGKPETLLETNRILLSSGPKRKQSIPGNNILVPPVYVAKTAHIKNCVLGPHVSIDNGATVEESILSDSIVGAGATVKDIVLESSIIGPNAYVRGPKWQLNVGDSSVIDFYHEQRPEEKTS